ncbi:ABC transporter permease [Micromonospora sp. LHW51205]|uniref:ABC transporter permease n=1 Tax=Micromonospora sp. LHW51205 TaxID=2248752 RepID=UPI000DEB9BC6|nr:ABC transporter permease [Micromonospora sp. LHW51205]RBQ03898.1 ABC transporter permease [Micromonospora sp. LHW51205]
MTAPAPARPLADLMPAARDLAEQLGGIPSRNRIMGELRVGAPKATALREALIAEAAEAAEAETVPDPWTFAEPASGPVPVSPAPAGSAGHAVGSGESATEPAQVPARSAAEPAEVEQVSPPVPAAYPPAPVAEALPQVAADGHPGTSTRRNGRRNAVWPLVLIGLPAFVAIWSGWVGLGGLTGFGVVHPLPGIADGFSINTAITLPIGVEVYAAYSLRAWLAGSAPARARRFAKWSGIGSLAVGALGQVAYHLLVAAGIHSAPWWITTLVACLPVAVLGMAAALAHLMHDDAEVTR